MAITNMTVVVDKAKYGTPLVERHVVVYVQEAKINPILSFSSKVPYGVCQSTQKFKCQPVVSACVLKDKIMKWL